MAAIVARSDHRPAETTLQRGKVGLAVLRQVPEVDAGVALRLRELLERLVAHVAEQLHLIEYEIDSRDAQDLIERPYTPIPADEAWKTLGVD